MREKGSWSSKTYRSTAEEVKGHGGRSTFKAEQQFKQSGHINPLVDPKSHDGWRESNNLLVPEGEKFVLKFGVALPVKTDVDATGSMGDNVDKSFRALPRLQELVVLGPGAVLKNGIYQPQFSSGIIQDIRDQNPYMMSEFEPDNEIDNQMRLLLPEGDGKDPTEDYQLGLFSAGLRTRASITKYGLKGYYFIVGDEIGRGSLTRSIVSRVFGEKAAKDLQSDIDVKDLGKIVRQSWHAFYLQIGNHSHTANYWSGVLGRENIVVLPRTEMLPEVQALIIGLTEGVLDLQNAKDFLMGECKITESEAVRLIRAASHIPLRAQAQLLNFNKLPKPGSIFKSREDIWPEGMNNADVNVSADHQPSEEPVDDVDIQL